MELWDDTLDDYRSDDEENPPPFLPGMLPLPDLSPFRDIGGQLAPQMLLSPAPRPASPQPTLELRTVPTLASLCSDKVVAMMKAEAQQQGGQPESGLASAVGRLPRDLRDGLLDALLSTCSPTSEQVECLSTASIHSIDFSEQLSLPAKTMARTLEQAQGRLVTLRLDGLVNLEELIHGLVGCHFPCISYLSVRAASGTRAPDSAIAELVSMCPNLIAVSLESSRAGDASGRASCMSATMAALSRCGRLSQLDVSGTCGLAWPAFSEVLSCPISVLRMNGCKDFATDDVVTSVTSALGSQLLELAIGGCTQVTDEGLQAIAHHSKRLQVLRLKDCYEVTSRGLRAIAGECSRLQEVNIDGCFEVDDGALTAFAEHALRESLQVVSFCDCTRVTGAGVEALMRGCSNLRDIDLLHVMSTGLDPLQCVSEHCPQLRYLRYKGPETTVDRELLRSLVTRIPAVEVMCIQDAKFIDDACLAALSKAWAPSLRMLSLTHCPRLTFDGLQQLAKCRQLTSINLSGCGSLNNSGLRLLAKSAEMLEVANLSGIAALSNKTLESFAKHCPRLTSVSVLGCTKLLPRSLTALARRCDGLRLIRTGPFQVDDSSMLSVGANCRLVQELHISGGLELTDDAFTSTLLLIPRVHTIELTDCALLTNDSIRTMGTSSPLLSSLLLVACPGLDAGIFEHLLRCKSLTALFLGEGMGFDPDNYTLASFVSARPSVSVLGPGISLTVE